MISYVSADYALSDVERFTALSVRRGLPLASLLKAEPADRRAVAGAALLASAGRTLARSELLATFERFLSGPGDWLAMTPGELLALVRGEELALPVSDESGPWENRLEPRPGVTAGRLEDELEAARTILAERRLRMRERLQARNRAANPPPAPSSDPDADRRFMAMALEEARAARDAGEIPVGAVVVRSCKVLARAGNETLRSGDPTAHAEVLALRRAAAAAGNHRLSDATLFVTLEPCPMCAGAISEARCARIVFGAGDVRRGALEGALRLFDLPGVNHRPVIEGGLMAEEGAALMREFFEARRREQ